MATIGVVVLTLAVWFVVAWDLALLVGRIIDLADKHLPPYE